MSVSRKSIEVHGKKKLKPNSDFNGKEIADPCYVSFEDLSTYSLYLPEKVDIKLGYAKTISHSHKHISRNIPFVTQDNLPIGIVFPFSTFYKWNNRNVLVTSYRYSKQDPWFKITSSRSKKYKRKIESSESKSTNEPVFVSFTDVDHVMPLPHDVQIIKGYTRLESPRGFTSSKTTLVQKDDDIIGMIIKRATFNERLRRNIQAVSYGYNNKDWYLLPESKEVAVNSIDELIKTDEVTEEPITNVFVKDSLKFKKTIPKDARLVGGAKHYEVDGEDFEQETLFVVQLRDKKPTVIGEIVPRDIVSKKSYIPHYLIENRSYYSFDTKNNKRLPTSLSDVFPKPQIAVSPENGESTAALGIFSRAKKQKTESCPSSLPICSSSTPKATASQVPAFANSLKSKI